MVEESDFFEKSWKALRWMESNMDEKLCKSIMKGLARRNRERETCDAGGNGRGKFKVLCASMTSLERSYHGMQFAKLVNKS